MSLREPTSKMSKSHADPRSRILLTDTPDEIRAKIKAAVTDSGALLTYDPIQRPGVSNLLDILCHFGESRSIEALVHEYRNVSMLALKESVADSVITALEPIRARFNHLITDKNELARMDHIAQQGRERANASSCIVLEKVYNVLGLS